VAFLWGEAEHADLALMPVAMHVGDSLGYLGEGGSCGTRSGGCVVDAQVTMVPPRRAEAPNVSRPGCSKTMSGSWPLVSSRIRWPKRRRRRLLPGEVFRLGHQLVRLDEAELGQATIVGLEPPDPLGRIEHRVVVPVRFPPVRHSGSGRPRGRRLSTCVRPHQSVARRRTGPSRSRATAGRAGWQGRRPGLRNAGS